MSQERLLNLCLTCCLSWPDHSSTAVKEINFYRAVQLLADKRAKGPAKPRAKASAKRKTPAKKKTATAKKTPAKRTVTATAAKKAPTTSATTPTATPKS